MWRRRLTAPSRLALGALAWALVVGCGDAGPPAASLVDDVDPFVGTGGHGHVYPGATVPWGTVQLSPDNGRGGWDWTAGYHWSDSVIVGFSHTHLSGTGIGDLLDVLVAPVVGATDPGDGPTPGPGPEGSDARLGVAWASRFRHADERAEPGYYRVRLADSGIEAELTATPRVGLHRYVFPDGADRSAGDPAAPDGRGPTGEPGNVGLVVDLGYARNWDTPVDASVRLVDDTLLLGHRRSTGWARDQRVFFAMALSRPVARVVAAGSGAARREIPVPGGPGGGAADGPAASAPFSDSLARALLLFDRRDDDTLLVKVGLSHVSERGALDNLRAEAPGWDFDAARRAARAAWADELGKVRVTGGSDADRRTLYTALYHTRVCPVVFEDTNGLYRGADGAVRRADGYTRHAIFSLWDTFRTQHPLMTLIDPGRVPDLVGTMVAFQRESGLLPIWSLLGNETNTMTGHHGVPVVVDAALKGLSPVDSGELFEAVEASTESDGRALPLYRDYGWIPADLEVESVTRTLEYAFDDWAASRLAEALGRDDLAARWRERAGWWRNVLDPRTRFMRGRLADGSWREPFDPFHASHREDTDFTEGNAWQHTWFVPHDVRGLIDAMGGDDAFVRKLDSLFEADTVVTGENVSPDISGLIGQYAHGNEPSHHIAYLYHWAGRPWRSADRVRQILATQYGDRPDGLAGNEDCGQMSAWYVASAVGLYPVDPVGGTWVIGSPLFEETTLDVGGGRTFTVRAAGVSDSLRYVRAARLNGRPLERSWLHHGEVVAGGVLELEMAAEPGETWGTAREDRPPSMSDELSPYPPATLPGATPPSPAAGSAPPDTVRRPVRSASDLAPDTASARRVRDAFLHAWNGYLEHARGHDALRPLSLTGRDWYDASLVMTPLDAYDTMLLMGLDAEAAEAKRMILEDLDFDRDFSVQVFEV
ncbi:MAG: GH92 family glycosyl hydrolase, partial [Gemmatimonadota bacterium]